MKFVVTNHYNNEVEVKLHWESKQKIKKIVGWTTVVAASVVAAKIVMDRQESSK